MEVRPVHLLRALTSEPSDMAELLGSIGVVTDSVDDGVVVAGMSYSGSSLQTLGLALRAALTLGSGTVTPFALLAGVLDTDDDEVDGLLNLAGTDAATLAALIDPQQRRIHPTDVSRAVAMLDCAFSAAPGTP